MKRTYQGSCHCGNVRFEVDLDLDAGTGKCNCSICTKTRSWSAILSGQDFRPLSGEQELADYQFGARRTHHLFCKTCGVRPYSTGHVPDSDQAFYAINLLCLNDLDPSELAEAPVQYVDGRNENWELQPAEVRHL